MFYDSFVYIQHVACGEMSTVVATEDSLLFWGSRPMLQSSISCPIHSSHSNNSSKDSTVVDPDTKKRSSSTSSSSSVFPPLTLGHRELKTSSSVPDAGLAALSDGEDTTATPFLLQCKSANDTNRASITNGSQYGDFLVSILESSDTKRHAPNSDTSANINDWKKVFLSSHEIQFCTENGVMLDVASSEISKLKVEGIACYGSNLLVLAEGQVAVVPTSMTDILDDPDTETTTLANDTVTGASSRTPFVMGRRLARQSMFRRIDSR